MFEVGQQSVTWTELYHETSDFVPGSAPAPRSSHCAGFYGNTMYVFGGEDEDHVKLDDLWSFSIDAKSWSKVDTGDSVSGRSGHSASI
jgi:N-acetylneuraminic acid mutarotase